MGKEIKERFCVTVSVVSSEEDLIPVLNFDVCALSEPWRCGEHQSGSLRLSI